MSHKDEPRTFSQALFKLGKIRSIEDPITFGLIGFHQAKNLGRLSPEESSEMKRYLELFEESCRRFTKIASLSKEKETKTLEVWLTKGRENERTSRIDTYAGFSLVSKDIQEKLPDFQFLCKAARKALSGKIKENEIERSLEKLENIQRELSEKLEVERRASEKVISGRLPFIYHGTTR